MTASNKRLTYILLSVVVLLLIPFFGMQFSNEVNWSAFDFIVAGVLLFGTGLTIEGVLRFVKSRNKRILLCIGILFALFLLWAELAVGIFGSPIAGS